MNQSRLFLPFAQGREDALDEALHWCDHDGPPCGPTCNAEQVRKVRREGCRRDAEEFMKRIGRRRWMAIWGKARPSMPDTGKGQ